MQHLLPHPGSVFLPMITTHRTKYHILGQSLWHPLGQLCLPKPCLPWLASAMHEMVVVSLCHPQWKPPVFLNNSRSKGNWVSSSETGMVIRMGCSQTPLDLQDHSGCLVGWGCYPLSGHWFQVSVHLGHSIWLTWKQCLWIETPDEFIQLGTKTGTRKQGYKWACSNCIFSMVSQRSVYLSPTDSFADMGTLPPREKGTHQPSWTTSVAI